jgi:hypothetical protein
VGCRKNSAETESPRTAGGAEYVSAALNNARTSPSPTVMMGRANFLIFLFRLHSTPSRRLEGIYTACSTKSFGTFSTRLVKYITTVPMSRRAAPLARRCVAPWRQICEMAPHLRRTERNAVQVKALTLWDALILMNSILYMYLHVLLKYNARVAARAQQLTRREELKSTT